MTNPVCTYDFTLPKNETYNTFQDVINLVCKDWAKKWTFQLERGDSGYEHWQGRVSLIKKRRISELLGKWCIGGHISITSTEGQNNFYVTKADTRVLGPWKDDEYVEPPILTRQLNHFMKQEMRPWQQQVEQFVREEDDRSIKLIIDKIGNSGKSIMCEYLEYNQLAYEIPPMREMQDIMQCVMGIPTHKAYLIDMPRALKKDKLASFYSGLESLKNGVAYDPRYSFKKKRFNRPQVIVFTNTDPDFSLLSEDRWELYDMTIMMSLEKRVGGASL